MEKLNVSYTPPNNGDVLNDEEFAAWLSAKANMSAEMLG